MSSAWSALADAALRQAPGSGAARRLCNDGRVRFSVQVEVSLRDGVADPQGATIERALPTLGFAGVGDVRVGKSIRFQLEARDEASARAEVASMCERFLTNPVIEHSTVTLEATDRAGAR